MESFLGADLYVRYGLDRVLRIGSIPPKLTSNKAPLLIFTTGFPSPKSCKCFRPEWSIN